MTQQVSCTFAAASPPPAWDITVIADIDVKPSVANPALWSVTVPALASWSVVYAETHDGFATEADATAAGLAIAESQGWAEYPGAGKIKSADFPSMMINASIGEGGAGVMLASDTDRQPAKPSPAKRRRA